MQTPRFIEIAQALEIHEDQIASFGGTAGVRDEGLLDSALAQPRSSFGGQLLHSSIPEQAAAYLYHLAKNHPFVDGNKRTAFAVMDSFLRTNGYHLNLLPDETYRMVLQVVEGEMSKEDLSKLLQNNIVRQ